MPCGARQYSHCRFARSSTFRRVQLRGFAIGASEGGPAGGAFAAARAGVFGKQPGVFQRETLHRFAHRREIPPLGGSDGSLVVFRHQNFESRLRFAIDLVQLGCRAFPDEQVAEAAFEFLAHGSDDWRIDRVERLVAGESVERFFCRT